MVANIQTIAFQGVEAVPVEVQVHLAPGQNAFNVVGLPDKSVAESRERVRAALSAVGLALPYDRITINLSPADLLKEGSHYDVPIALGLLMARPCALWRRRMHAAANCSMRLLMMAGSRRRALTAFYASSAASPIWPAATG